MNAKIPYKCRCGGELKWSKVNVEFFGIDFGLKDAEVCTSCGSEYLGIHYKSIVQLFPVAKGQLEVKVVS